MPVGRRAASYGLVVLALGPSCQHQQVVSWTLRPVAIQSSERVPNLWGVLFANLIVKAVIQSNDSKSEDQGRPAVRLSLEVLEVYKGALDLNVRQIELSIPMNAAGNLDELRQSGHQGIFFLLKFERFIQRTMYELNRHAPPMITWTTALEQRTRDLVTYAQRSSLIVEARLNQYVPPLDGEVARLVRMLTLPEACSGAARRLDELGNEAIPALVKHLEDMRPLGVGMFAFRPRVAPFEGPIHYSLEVVADLLSVVLDRKAPRAMGHSWRGSSDFHRRNMIEGWRIWLGLALGLLAEPQGIL